MAKLTDKEKAHGIALLAKARQGCAHSRLALCEGILGYIVDKTGVKIQLSLEELLVSGKDQHVTMGADFDLDKLTGEVEIDTHPAGNCCGDAPRVPEPDLTGWLMGKLGIAG